MTHFYGDTPVVGEDSSLSLSANRLGGHAGDYLGKCKNFWPYLEVMLLKQAYFIVLAHMLWA